MTVARVFARRGAPSPGYDRPGRAAADARNGRTATTPGRRPLATAASATVIETRAGQTNARHELARYTVSAGERIIYAQRVLGVVRLVDEPVAGDGRRYVIERELTVMAELEALVADYLDQATTWGVIPAAGCCPLLAEHREAGR